MPSLSSPIPGTQCPSVPDGAMPQAQQPVRELHESAWESSDAAGKRMTDEEREEAIKRAGRAVEKHMAEWERSGCFAAKGAADRAMQLLYLLKAGRKNGGR